MSASTRSLIQRRRLVFAALVAVLSSEVWAGASASPVATTCSGTDIRVVGTVRADVEDVCLGVQAARAFLVDQGLVDAPTITVEVTSKLPDVVGPGAAGCFVQSQGRAYVLSYAEFKKKRTWFGVPVTRALYRSLATHETAHAIAGRCFAMPTPSIQATEYVAYVAMFATMPAPLRQRALKFMPGTGFADIGRVSSFVYLFDPMRFGTAAYRHFVSLDDGRRFLQDVMAGKVLAE